jgi:hypothetical protein
MRQCGRSKNTRSAVTTSGEYEPEDQQPTVLLLKADMYRLCTQDRHRVTHARRLKVKVTIVVQPSRTLVEMTEGANLHSNHEQVAKLTTGKHACLMVHHKVLRQSTTVTLLRTINTVILCNLDRGTISLRPSQSKQLFFRLRTHNPPLQSCNTAPLSPALHSSQTNSACNPAVQTVPHFPFRWTLWNSHQ